MVKMEIEMPDKDFTILWLQLCTVVVATLRTFEIPVEQLLQICESDFTTVWLHVLQDQKLAQCTKRFKQSIRKWKILGSYRFLKLIFFDKTKIYKCEGFIN